MFGLIPMEFPIPKDHKGMQYAERQVLSFETPCE